MFRFIFSILWGLTSAFLVFAADDTIFVSFTAGAVFVCLIRLTLWGTGTIIAAAVAKSTPDTVSWQDRLKERPLLLRLIAWLVFYEFAPAVLIWFPLSAWGLFVLPHGLLTALAMCLPMSMVTLSDYVDLSWLAR